MKSVHVLLFNSDGELFVQKRSANVAKYKNLFTSSASGGIEKGESSKEAAKRELKEELGVENVPLKSIGEITINGREVSVFKGNYDGEFNINNYEVEDGFFNNINELEEIIVSSPQTFSPFFIEIFEKFGRATI